MIGRMNIVARSYLGLMWFIGTPAMMVFIISYAFIGFKPLHIAYDMEFSELIYPTWTTVIGNELRVKNLLIDIFSTFNDVFAICTNSTVFPLCSCQRRKEGLPAKFRLASGERRWHLTLGHWYVVPFRLNDNKPCFKKIPISRAISRKGQRPMKRCHPYDNCKCVW